MRRSIRARATSMRAFLPSRQYMVSVLSKLPYVNRLFRNVGYGREAQSLLLMVTPRIIINSEEEELQTGVIVNPAIQ